MEIIEERTGLTVGAFFLLNVFFHCSGYFECGVSGFPVDIVRRWPIAEVTTLKYM